jgi:hypothetical protein
VVNERIGVAVAHAMLRLRPGDMLHMFGSPPGADQRFPFGYRTAVGLLIEGK